VPHDFKKKRNASACFFCLPKYSNMIQNLMSILQILLYPTLSNSKEIVIPLQPFLYDSEKSFKKIIFFKLI